MGGTECGQRRRETEKVRRPFQIVGAANAKERLHEVVHT